PVAGLLLHYFISCIWAACYYFISRNPIRKNFLLLNGLGIAVVVWAVMNLLVIPIAFGRAIQHPLAGALKGIPILFVSIGLPFVFIINPAKGKRKKDAG
ncbi:MAG TPA: hypothetical protein VGM24_02125, partial [Puia sp.]